MAREYQAEYASDCAALTFIAEGQREAVKIASDHAAEGEEFTLKARDSKADWNSIKRSSYWRVGYGLEPCRRVR